LTAVQSSNTISFEKEDSHLSLLKNDSDLEKADMIIVVMGPTGAGRTRLICEANQSDLKVKDSLESSKL
jgi:predicted GTPase